VGRTPGAARYLFAYGSLIQRAARVTTVPGAGSAYPAKVRGLRRGWWFQYAPEFGRTLSPTYLGAMPDTDAVCNGVVFELPATGLEALAWREQGYVPTMLDPADIEVIAGNVSLDHADVWYYATHDMRTPTERHPIVQTYVDICVGGCLEIEEDFPAARAASFARQFLETTVDWEGPWINDRLLPWRPSIHEPRAWDIDELVAEVLGDGLFDQIRVPGQ
jgi:hypothetical protein